MSKRHYSSKATLRSLWTIHVGDKFDISGLKYFQKLMSLIKINLLLNFNTMSEFVWCQYWYFELDNPYYVIKFEANAGEQN